MGKKRSEINSPNDLDLTCQGVEFNLPLPEIKATKERDFFAFLIQ
jgi:hypothetical protein